MELFLARAALTAISLDPAVVVAIIAASASVTVAFVTGLVAFLTLKKGQEKTHSSLAGITVAVDGRLDGALAGLVNANLKIAQLEMAAADNRLEIAELKSEVLKLRANDSP